MYIIAKSLMKTATCDNENSNKNNNWIEGWEKK